MKLEDVPVNVTSQIKLGTLLEKVNRKLKKAGFRLVVVKREKEE